LGSFGCVLGYDEDLAHLVQAGVDALIVPSRFEPCGLTQLCAMRYGALPVVARVGGLTDTVTDVTDVNDQEGTATGFQFYPVTPEALEQALQRALTLWSNAEGWARIQRNAMATDVSWSRSAKRYLLLFRDLLANRS
jgi:starch synthase